MNYKEYINSNASGYKQNLLDDLKTNKDFNNIVNSVFFPSGSNINTWLEETEVKSFYDYQFRGDPFFNRICTRDEIDCIPSLNTISGDVDRYSFFSCLKCDSYEEAIEKTPGFYHFTQKDFHKRIDKIILESLNEYKRETSNINAYTKRISEHIDLMICTDREYVELQGIVGYTFPSLSINIKNEGSIQFDTIDVRSLLFLPTHSFLFFYTDCHNYTIDELSGTIRDVTRKNDEPVIYYLEEEQKYMATNSWENIDRYNKYIQIVLELSFHYFSVFEKWLVRLLNEKHLN